MKKILLVTNSELGQANIFLAAGHALVSRDPDVEVHYASFPALSKPVFEASRYALRCSPKARPFVFHALEGVSFIAAFMAVNGLETISKSPGLASTPEYLKMMMKIVLPWSAPGFITIFRSLVRVIEDITPDFVVVDPLFGPGLTVCDHLGLKHMILSPNAVKDMALASQPWGAMFWKYPISGSALPYPVPWSLLPLNIYYGLCAVWYHLTERDYHIAAAAIKRETGVSLVTFDKVVMDRRRPERRILVASRPEIDFPLVVPPHIIPCGPIIRPVPAVSEIDPDLDAWLRGGPTVLVNLGSHMVMTEADAVEMAGALRALLNAASSSSSSAAEVDVKWRSLRVLWKLKKHTAAGGGYGFEPVSALHDILGKELDDDRVRVVDWLACEPVALLETGNVVCAVSHGGANSVHEAIHAGVPQVLLPSWADCYDFAIRVEYLGIGCWGNRRGMPRWTASELGPILVEVVMGHDADKMRARAKELVAVCSETPGSAVAADAILAELAS
ncbi:glycosyltransferase family 1 protein [Parathielavia appendiculata]|uniref:Glycosyltransferase family 1 protein n=1 Tax=Parathielavia appendiculata TaxID=2587402 RepID=A0AAN6YZX2_9PEZI|nr:glycosyltransferase family 1 protein [Parathielavia appendiculata]